MQSASARMLYVIRRQVGTAATDAGDGAVSAGRKHRRATGGESPMPRCKLYGRRVAHSCLRRAPNCNHAHVLLPISVFFYLPFSRSHAHQRRINVRPLEAAAPRGDLRDRSAAPHRQRHAHCAHQIVPGDAQLECAAPAKWIRVPVPRPPRPHSASGRVVHRFQRSLEVWQIAEECRSMLIELCGSLPRWLPSSRQFFMHDVECLTPLKEAPMSTGCTTAC